MKQERRFHASLWVMALCLMLSVCAAHAVAGDDTRTASKYLVSAKAGVINFISGRAEFQRDDRQGWRSLTTKEALRAGDIARTAPDGRFEMLLTPGSYLRVGGDAEFELTDTSLESLALNLRKGTVIVEALSANDDAPLLTLTTPHTQVAILRGGIYRISADANNTAVGVRKGRAGVGGNLTTLVKGGRKIVVPQQGSPAASSIATTEVVKFEKRERDELDLWSKERAEELARVNRRLSSRTLANALSGYSAFNDPFGWGSRTYGFRSSGIWVFDASRNCNTFVPFGWYGRSPYGGNYSTAFGYTGGINNGRFIPVTGGSAIAPGNNSGARGNNPGVLGGGNSRDSGGMGQPRGDSPQPSSMPTRREMPIGDSGGNSGVRVVDH